MKVIKLAEILSETTKRSQYLRKPIFMNALTRGHFRSAYNKFLEKNSIFRGITGSAAYPYWIVQPGKVQRVSRNTSNFYTGLLDGLPSWKNYPKRSKSIICSTNYDGARSFGNVLNVFPKNGARLAICPEEDFWMSFESTMERRLGLSDMSYFNSYFISIFHNTSKDLAKLAETLDEESYSEFIQKADQLFDKQVYIDAIKQRHAENRLPWGINVEQLIADVENHFKDDWEQYFDDMLNPKTNDFTLTTIENYDVAGHEYCEIWTDATSLMISHAATQELVQSELPTKTEPDTDKVEI